MGALAAEDRAHRRIQHLCNGLVGVLHHPRNGFPEVCVAPEFGRNVQGKQQIGHLRLRVGRRYQRRADMAAQVADSGCGSGDVAGLSHHVAHAQLAKGAQNIIVIKAGGHQHHGTQSGTGGGLQQTDAVQLGKHQIKHQNVRDKGTQKRQCLFPVAAAPDMVCPLQLGGKRPPEFLVSIRNQQLHCVHMSPTFRWI